MSIGVLVPAALAALLALLLPMLIHLSRRAEQRRTEFAALRWLSAQLRPRQQLRFEERLLLLLRLLLLAALVLLLARPVLFGAGGDAPWVLVARGVDVAAARKNLGLPNARWHWLAEGFPDIEQAMPAQPPPTASLLRELDALLPARTPVTVFVPEELEGADAARVQLARRVDWRIMPGRSPAAAAVARQRAPTLVVRHAAEREPQLPYLRAATAAWSVADAPAMASATGAPSRSSSSSTSGLIDIAPVPQPLPAQADWLVWLAPGALPPQVRHWIEQGGTALLDSRVEIPEKGQAVAQWRDAEGDVLVRGVAMGRGRVLLMTRPLLPDAWPGLLDGQFPTALRSLFEGEPPPPGRVHAAAYQPLAGGATFPETPRPLQPWLVAIVALLFALERWFASHPRRRQTP